MPIASINPASNETIRTFEELSDSALESKVAQAAKYHFDGRMSLVIRVASTIFDRMDFDIYGEDIVIPEPNTFDEIWLLFRDAATNAFSDLKQIQ